ASLLDTLPRRSDTHRRWRRHARPRVEHGRSGTSRWKLACDAYGRLLRRAGTSPVDPMAVGPDRVDEGSEGSAIRRGVHRLGPLLTEPRPGAARSRPGWADRSASGRREHHSV